MTTASLLSAGAGIARLSRSASCIVGKAAGGFHLLRVEGYSHTKMVPGGESIDSPYFSIGGRDWVVKYYTNGRDSSTNSDYISLYTEMYGYSEPWVQGQYKMSILDQAGNVAYGLAAKTGVFKSGRGTSCGHERFIRREDLERRDDLIKNNCVVFRCDISDFTELNTSCLAREDGNDDQDGTDDDEYGLKPMSDQYFHGSPAPPATAATARMTRNSSVGAWLRNAWPEDSTNVCVMAQKRIGR